MRLRVHAHKRTFKLTPETFQEAESWKAGETCREQFCVVKQKIRAVKLSNLNKLVREKKIIAFRCAVNVL